MLGLAFVFICLFVSTVWNEEAVFRANRFDQQERVEKDILEPLQEYFGQKVEKSTIGNSGAGEPSRYSQSFLYSIGGKPVAKVQRNSNLQRIQIFEEFHIPGKSDMTEESKTKMRNLYGAILKNGIAGRKAEIIYLFLHGIVERAEQKGAYPGGIAPSPEDWEMKALFVSQNRANNLKRMLADQGFIAPRNVSVSQARNSNQMPTQFTLAYGTGDLPLYQRGNDTPVGRVDLVLFYPERKEDLENLTKSN